MLGVEVIYVIRENSLRHLHRDICDLALTICNMATQSAMLETGGGVENWSSSIPAAEVVFKMQDGVLTMLNILSNSLVCPLRQTGPHTALRQRTGVGGQCCLPQSHRSPSEDAAEAGRQPDVKIADVSVCAYLTSSWQVPPVLREAVPAAVAALPQEVHVSTSAREGRDHVH
eukprot:694423-Hanusia_phi.AAC.2